MREIKFRVWTGKIILDPTDNLHITGNEGYWHLENCYNYKGYDVPSKWDGDNEDSILMQYTGLKDKNGKEIYEGDIMDGMVVVFGQYFNHQGFYLMEYFKGKFRLIPIINSNTYKIKREVMGNIYENPELIKKGVRK